jgi:hypothetical protein
MSNPPIKQKYIESPELLLKAWNDYKDIILNNPDIQEVATAKGVQQIKVKRPFQRKGFESYFFNMYGHHVKQYIDNEKGAYDAYLGVVTHMRNEWESDQIDGSLTGRYKSPNLVARLNGLVDKQENNIKVEQEIFKALDIDAKENNGTS